MKLAGPVALVYSLITIHLWPVTAALVNRTIDDQFGDSVTGLLPVYSPAKGVWDNQTCVGCAIKADVTRAFMGTYSAATYNPGLTSMGITMRFSGTAIYVFFILANNQGDGITTITQSNFSVDGGLPVPFLHAPNLATTAFQYNSLVFSRTNLSNGDHRLDITTTGSINIYVNFDYAIYTQDDTPPISSTTSLSHTTQKPSATTSGTMQSTTTGPPATTSTTPPSSAKSIGAIVGGVVGGLGVAALVALVLLCWYRRRNSGTPRKNPGNEGNSPPVTQFNGAASAYGSSSSSAQLLVHSTASIVPMANSETSHGGSQDGYVSNSNRDPVDQSNMRNAYQTLPSGQVVLYPSGSTPLPSLLPSTSIASDTQHLSLPQPTQNPAIQTQEEIRRARQAELDNRLRTVQQEMQEMQELRSDMRPEKAGPGRSLSLRRQRTLTRKTGEVEVTEEEVDMSVSDMKEEIRSMKEQIRMLKEQRRSPWAEGLSDDPPPGYTPTETRRRDVLM